MGEKKKSASLVVNEKRKAKGIIISQIVAYAIAVTFIALSIFFYLYLRREQRPDIFVAGNIEYKIKNGELAVIGLSVMQHDDTLEIPSEVNDLAVAYIESLLNCQLIKQIVIPATVKAISRNAFERADSLKFIVVDIHNDNFASAEGVLYSKNFAELIKFPSKHNLDSPSPLFFEVPDKVVTLAERSFSGAVNLSGVRLPEGLIEIGNFAFEGCQTLSTVHIGDGVRRIGTRAFYRCASLLSFMLPSELKELGEACFFECPLLTSFSISTENDFFVTKNNVLYSRGAETLLAYPGGATETVFIVDPNTREIAPYAFCSNSHLKKISFLGELAVIGLNAFEGCVALKMVVLDSALVPEINAVNAFSYEINYYVPQEMLTEYKKDPHWKNATDNNAILYAKFEGDFAYIVGKDGAVINGYSGEDDAVLPSYINGLKVTEITRRAFNGNRLESIVFGEHIAFIEDGAFKKFGNLKRVVFSPFIESIGAEAFFGCSRLSDVIFTRNINEYTSLSLVGDSAFENCVLLKNITFPALSENGETEAIVLFGESAFNNCTSLENITLLCKSAYNGKNQNGLITNNTTFILIVADSYLDYYRTPAQFLRWSINQSVLSERIIPYSFKFISSP